MPELVLQDATIAYDMIGAGPAVLLLHGFPQTRALWAKVALDLARDHTVVTADLRGYGQSSKPDYGDGRAYSFRAMGQDQLSLMAALGFERFDLVGHDRGGRVAHRLALDHPPHVRSLTVMDIVPTAVLLDRWTAEIATDYWHWTYLAQPAPFAETMIGHDPESFFTGCLLGWGGARLEDFDPTALADYRKAWVNAETIRGMCADYRATLTIDRMDDLADMSDGKAPKVQCPALVLYGADGVMARHFDIAEVWSPMLARMTAHAMPGGHFFVDQFPSEVSRALAGFLAHAGAR